MKRILALTTDCYGGRGGIATYARDTVRAMAAREDVREVVLVMLVRPDPLAAVPDKVTVVDWSRHGKIHYVASVLGLVARGGFDAVWASHSSLAPLALLAARWSNARVGVSLHGTEVWTKGPRLTEWALSRTDLLMPVSKVTLSRYLAARGEGDRPHAILPGAVDLSIFTPGPRPAELIERYGLGGRTIALTAARIAPDFRKKGFSALPPNCRR